jgi:AraC-like DNA-binding protein
MSDEFASAAMLRVLTQGLRKLHLPSLERPADLKANAGATVDMDLKLALVQHALEQGGIDCLIQLGRGVHQNANEPTHSAMMGARSPTELVLRWQRLERYIHSRHRLRIAAQGDQWLELTHGGVSENIFPSLYESLVVFGVIAALLQARGVRGLEVRAGKLKVFPEAKRRGLKKLPVVDPLRTWRLSWQDFQGRSTVDRSAGGAEDLYAYSDWPHWQQRLVDHIVGRLIDIPSATDAALGLGVSLRTLQRDLKQRDLTFSELVGECRARKAALHLIECELPLAEVGFLCGYSDQAHFTREFGKRVGIPPQKYRMAFRKG